MQMAILLISFSNNIFPSQINSQTHKSIKVHAEQIQIHYHCNFILTS